MNFKFPCELLPYMTSANDYIKTLEARSGVAISIRKSDGEAELSIVGREAGVQSAGEKIRGVSQISGENAG